MNKWILWGGAGVAALVGGVLLFRGGAAPAASTDTTGSAGYYPPMVYGGASGSSATDTTSGTSTDNSIAQLIAGNLATAQEQSNLTKYTSDNDKAVALATLGSQQAIASNDNATKLAMQLASNRNDIQKTLAEQVGSITANLTGTKAGVAGAIGFDPNSDAILLNIHTAQRGTNGAWN